MKYLYDRKSDSLTISFAEGRRYRDSEEIHEGVVLHLDTAGKPIGIEFTDRASRYVDTEGLASGRWVYVEHPDVPAAQRRSLDGESLRAARSALGMTQEQLGDVVGVPKNTVARWERNEVRIEHPRMLKLALEQLGHSASKSRALLALHSFKRAAHLTDHRGVGQDMSGRFTSRATISKPYVKSAAGGATQRDRRRSLTKPAKKR